MTDSVPNTSNNAADDASETTSNGAPSRSGVAPSDGGPIPVGTATFQQLDRRWIGLKRTVEAMHWGVLGIIALIAGLIFMNGAPIGVRMIVVVGWLLLTAVALFRMLWWPRWVYDHWSYRVDSKVFELRHGLLWHVSVLVPLSRLQHVDLHRGPLERRCGLASLQIHTAGTKEASQMIPGLDIEVAQSLRDRLIDSANRGGRGGNEPTST